MSRDNEKPATVADLIAHLQTFNPTLPVLYVCCSDYSELYLREVVELQLVFKGGWASPPYSRREGHQKRPAVVFPGN